MIKRISPDPVSTSRKPAPAPPLRAREDEDIPEVQRASRTDRVEISRAGRELAAQDSSRSLEAVGELSPERIAEIQQKIAVGAYNSVEFAEELARRMISVVI